MLSSCLLSNCHSTHYSTIHHCHGSQTKQQIERTHMRALKSAKQMRCFAAEAEQMLFVIGFILLSFWSGLMLRLHTIHSHPFAGLFVNGLFDCEVRLFVFTFNVSIQFFFHNNYNFQIIIFKNKFN